MSKITDGLWIIGMEPETWCDAGDDGRTVGGYTGELEPTGDIYVENNDADGTVTYICHGVQNGANLRLIAASPALLNVVERLCYSFAASGVEPVKDSNDPLEALFHDAAEIRMKIIGHLCKCGCGKPAEWLISGYSPEGTYENEPACNSAAQYVEECAAQFNCEFSKKRIVG